MKRERKFGSETSISRVETAGDEGEEEAECEAGVDEEEKNEEEEECEAGEEKEDNEEEADVLQCRNRGEEEGEGENLFQVRRPKTGVKTETSFRLFCNAVTHCLPLRAIPPSTAFWSR